MPLMHGKSKKAFKHNVAVEMEKHPGKEHEAQNLAIAYAIKRKAEKEKHMAKGGHIKGVHKEVPAHLKQKHEDKGVSFARPLSKEAADIADSKAIHKGIRQEMAKIYPKLKGLAHGGMLTHKGYQPKADHHYDADFPDMDHDKEEMASGYVHHQSAKAKHDAAAEHEDHKMLNQHGAHEKGPEGRHYAMGGYAKGGEAHPHQGEEHEMDMVGKIMKQRQHVYAKGGECYSKGGQVANDDHPFEYSFKEPAQYDDLVKDDDLEFHYTGDNSGDHLGDAREDHDRHDIVSKIMKSRAKKDKYPKGYPGL